MVGLTLLCCVKSFGDARSCTQVFLACGPLLVSKEHTPPPRPTLPELCCLQEPRGSSGPSMRLIEAIASGSRWMGYINASLSSAPLSLSHSLDWKRSGIEYKCGGVVG